MPNRRRKSTAIALHNEAQKYTEMVKQALADFAISVWGDPSCWIWSSKPKYRNAEADLYDYAWIGSVSRRDAQYASAVITSNERFCAFLEASDSGHNFRVLVFRDYGYHILETSISYLFLTEVSLKTELTDQDLLAGIKKLHNFLKDHPIQLTTEGYERPEQIDVTTQISSGIELRTRVLAKHS
jgi:hypothetical protein